LDDDGGTGRRKKRTADKVGRAALADKPDRAGSQTEKKLTCNKRKAKCKEREKEKQQGGRVAKRVDLLTVEGEGAGGYGRTLRALRENRLLGADQLRSPGLGTSLSGVFLGMHQWAH